ncbi:MAG: hypothetical protein K0S25_1692, partial [Bacillus sp. (in: firmicutes)]|nr:hypothetical protein [Bacillus sp. (in: firmicutes)]
WVLNDKNEESIIEIKYLNVLSKEHPKYLQTMRQIAIQKNGREKIIWDILFFPKIQLERIEFC